MKKLLAMLLALVVALSMTLTACAEEDPAKILTEGVWEYSFPVEGLGDYTYYFHFYEDVPGYGGVYYAGFALNQLNFAGTWSVEVAEKAFDVYMAHGDQETVQGTAPYTINFCDWNGTLVEQCAFDGEKIYNDMEKIYGMYSGPCVYTHVTDPAASNHASVFEAEKDMAILDFVAEDDPTCTMTIYHNGRYMDLVSLMVEGNWAMEEQADGSRVYTLTPDDELDTPAVLTVAADGQTAHYANEDDEEMDMVSTAQNLEAAYTMAGTFNFMEDLTAAMTLTMYTDGTCELVADVFGNTSVMDSGTWTLADDGFTFTLNLEKAGELVSELDTEAMAPAVHYTQAGTDIGDVDTILTVVVE